VVVVLAQWVAMGPKVLVDLAAMVPRHLFQGLPLIMVVAEVAVFFLALEQLIQEDLVVVEQVPVMVLLRSLAQPIQGAVVVVVPNKLHPLILLPLVQTAGLELSS